MGKPKTSVIWKTSDRKAKRDSWAVIQRLWGAFGFMVFKVIWGHSVHLLFFPKIQVSMCCFFCTYDSSPAKPFYMCFSMTIHTKVTSWNFKNLNLGLGCSSGTHIWGILTSYVHLQLFRKYDCQNASSALMNVSTKLL